MAHQLSYAHLPQQITTVDRAGRSVLRVIVRAGWILLTLGILSGAMALGVGMGGQPSGYFGIMMAVLLLIAWGRWRVIACRRRVELLLAPIRLAVSLNLPLQPTIEAAQQGESGRLRRQMIRLNEVLSTGSSLAAALQYVAPEMPARTVNTIVAAEHTGTLPAALGRLLEEGNREHSSDSVNRSVQFSYLLTVLISMLLLVGLITVFVLPKFEVLMSDFKIVPPWEFSTLMAITRSWVWELPLTFVVALTLICMVGSAVQGIFSRSENRKIFRALTDRVLWYLPIVHDIQQNSGLADACEILADSFMNGSSATDAVDLAIQPHLNRVLCAKLRGWSNRMKDGVPFSTAAAAAGLPTLMVALLASSPIDNGAVPAFRFLARYYRDRHNRLIVLLSAALAPISSLVIGGIVLVITLAIFRTVVSLEASVVFPGAP